MLLASTFVARERDHRPYSLVGRIAVAAPLFYLHYSTAAPPPLRKTYGSRVRGRQAIKVSISWIDVAEPVETSTQKHARISLLSVRAFALTIEELCY